MVWIALLIIYIILLIAFPKVIGSITALVVFGIGAIFASQHFSDQERKRNIEKLEVRLSYNSDSCDSEKPILVSIRNGHSKPTKVIRFGVVVARRGYSFPDYAGYDATFESRKILQPQETNSWCFASRGLIREIASIGAENAIFDARRKVVSYDD